MIGRRARRAAWALALSGAALLAGGRVRGTLALYEGSTTNTGSTFAGGWVHDATETSATPEGYDVALKWTPGSQGVATQKLYGEDKGTSSTCTSVPTHTLSTTLASASTSSYKDESRGTEATDGDWFCYELQGENGSWKSQGAFKSVQLGLVASVVSSANTATKCTGAATPTTGKIDCNDTITITFNQKTTLAAKSIVVCVFGPEKTIVLGEGSAGTTKCGAKPNGSYAIGEMVVAGAKVKTAAKFEKSSLTVSTSAPWTATITLEGSTNTSAVEKEGSSTPTWTFTPAAAIKSSFTTHQAVMCTAEKSTCRPTTTTNF